ncbi:endonuclease/exonuclease/phosphatase family protein [Duganella sp. S19_KUP01_CR8]|uniref:endonuclease/exonuclease/phosphatase family protein n=1 Tax=Duganella sp. S19_KUP01_CR8 TaxID=3025502 RepID=UPI002FCD8C93
MKILVWNIQFFTSARISTTAQNDLDRVEANLAYILSTIQQAAPDIFVVIEPRSNQGDVGGLARGNGPIGLVKLYAKMLGKFGSTSWNLVPPLRLNARDIHSSNTYTECVGVFWRNEVLEFTGPWVWTAAGARAPGEHTVAAAYPEPWNRLVPDDVTASGQASFYSATGEIHFPAEANRRPFLCTFRERGGTHRHLKVFAMHTSPSTARDACARMLGVNELAPNDNEISVLTGDFNLDLNSTNTAEQATLSAFALLTDLRVVRPPQVSGAYPGTLLCERPAANWTNYQRALSLDYAFVGYGANARIPGTFQPAVEVVNRVAGTPTPPFSVHMSTTLEQYRAIELLTQMQRGVDPTDATNMTLDLFRQRWNYGHIAQPRRTAPTAEEPGDGTSDHLPILVTV